VTFLVGTSVPLMAVVAIGPWFAGKPYVRSTWRLATAMALASAAVALLVNQVVSHLWDRPRPFVSHPGSVTLFVSHAGDASFPSDHAAASFAIAVSVLLLHRRTGGVLLLLAAAISVIRVFEGLHYPTDVLAGAAIGTVSAVVIYRFAKPLLETVVALVQKATDPVVAVVRR
jgi:undecaprenyl-diphosphatase